ncbi:SDR family NAD(P)-dependent oxidoreductase [Rhizorhabdus dicambivorans]|uniref:SDR family NAD(P)-dependent oxidoreductase n=1 Tax=Rhizorhabdus dicambivorans TaxID=1850238 RepID=UPI00083134C5|nr:SDR family NAD(P)-dependent oxidoreductase [Rhizorhabdus dicambivorans]
MQGETGLTGAPLRFDGKVAVVTGAGKGLGRAFAMELASRGAAVIVNDIARTEDGAGHLAAQVVEEIVASGGRAKANLASVAEAEGAASIVDDALSFGSIDIIINNAGCLLLGEFETFPIDDLITTFNVHVKGAFQIIQRAWPHMRKQGGGHVLNVASIGGNIVGNSNHAAYDTCKGALSGLTRNLALEGEPFGIKVNGLFPGAFTGMVKHAVNVVDQTISPNLDIDMRAELVGPTAAWLVHEECGLTGAFFASSSGRLGRVFPGVAEGFQDDPELFSMERIREHRERAHSTEPFFTPRTTQDFNKWRIGLFRAMQERRAKGAMQPAE